MPKLLFLWGLFSIKYVLPLGVRDSFDFAEILSFDHFHLFPATVEMLNKLKYYSADLHK